MKKNSFLEGAAIATIAIIISRIIGLLYVIPLYHLIGDQGGALYSYGYSIYVIFLSLSISGVPLAISKIVSEYTALNQNWTKERVYKLGTQMIFGLSFISFLVLFIFSKELAFLIIGEVKGGNTISDVTFVIRIISTALLIVPFLSVTRGYLQGQKYIKVTSISNVLEQIVRVTIILVGSYLSLKVFNLSIKTTVGISMFAATLGALVAYLYVFSVIKKHKSILKRDVKATEAEDGNNDKFLRNKIVRFALPLVFIDLMKSVKNLVDTFTYVRTLSHLGYPIAKVEQAFGTIVTWASKLNMIVISIVFGITMSLIPSLVSSNILNDKKDINKKINQSMQVLFFITIPMVVGLFFLAQPVWVIFYGYNEFSISIFRLYVFQAITFSFLSLLIDSMQSLNNIKHAMIGLLISFAGKLILNVPFMFLLHNIGIDAYYGSTITNLFTQFIAIGYMLYIFRKQYGVAFKPTIINGLKTMSSVIAMFTVIYIISLVYPVDALNRVDALFQTLFYSIIGAAVYIFISFKNKVIINVFGKRIIDIILVKLRLRKS